MQSKAKGEPKILYRIIANVGMVASALWLLTYLMPAARTIMLDAILAYILGLIVTALLWWTAYKAIHPRRFWGWLAAGWTIGLLGDTVWGVYELLTGNPLPHISLVDAIYLARYALVFVAFWRYLRVPTSRQWICLLVVLLLAAAAVGGGVLLSVPAARRTAPLLAGAIYPILDVGLMYIGLEARKQQPAGRLRNALGLLTLALLAYGAADWFSFYGQAIPFDPVIGLAALFWPLSDILAGIGVLCLFWTASPSTSAQMDEPGERPAPS
jgi:hypothetical protein